MKQLGLILFLVFALYSCMKGKHVDLIVHNAKIYAVDEEFTVYEAMAIKDGKIVEIGPERQILNKYTSDEELDAQGKDVFPGFTDAHGHILSLMEQRLNLDLVGCKSYQEMLFRVEKYHAKSSREFIVGRGWDQAVWGQEELPDNEALNEHFPNIPVLLIRVDGHAALVNDCLLKMAKFSEKSVINGGKILMKDGKPSGLILDNAITEVMKFVPAFSAEEKKTAFLEIQEELLQYGITGVHEAGMNKEDFNFFVGLNNKKDIKINLYGMLYPSKANLDYVRRNGKYNKNQFVVRSFKIIGDGSLGSRGACLKHAYDDDPLTKGFLITSQKELDEVTALALAKDFQVNIHAIGDSTNKVVLNLFKKVFAQKPDHRWRIEHAQVLDLNDFKLLGEYAAFPSVQPTHAVSDQRWALQRLGTERIKGAYAYRTILENAGILCLGTDFPVESFDPFATIHASVNRKNKENHPLGGFYPNESLSFEQTIRGMTIWAAFASFQEKYQGSLEKGKQATFCVLEYPVKPSGEYRENYAACVYIKGKKVYSTE